MTHLDLFSGSGIGILAAHEAGIETLAWCESDPWCRFALERLWPEAEAFHDITAIQESDLVPLGPINIVAGGFPCQDISAAGKGEGIGGKRSSLWFHFLRVVQICSPAWVLVENSPALRTRGGDVVLAGLEEAGYTCWPTVVGAVHAGAAHKRERVWIVARANAHRAGRKEQCGTGPVATARPTVECGSPFVRFARTPLRPEQHEWEHPRTIGTDACGEGLDGCAPGRGRTEAAEPDAESLLGSPVHGIPGALPTSARRAFLRVLGNAWVPEIPYQIYKWMRDQHEHSRS